MEENKIFLPHELKTIEIDVENKIFRINGEDFGSHCAGFNLWCNKETKDPTKDWFNVDMRVDASLRFGAKYDVDGKKTSEKVNGKSVE